MTLQWTAPEQTDSLEAALDWSTLIDDRRRTLGAPVPVGTRWQPLFVRLLPGPGAQGPKHSRQALRALLDAQNPEWRMEPHERDRLDARDGGPAALNGLADEYALYRKAAPLPVAPPSGLMDILDTGSPVWMSDPAAPPQPVGGSAQGGGKPIVAIIDEGVGFLNSRFSVAGAGGVRTTRFHALWLQAQNSAAGGNAPSAWLGRVLSRADIDAALAAGSALNEADHYSATNAQLFSVHTRRPTEFGAGHGTHMLDLAAGAEPDATDDPARDWPLIGVQLPPEAVADTSGTRFESHMLAGLRFVLWEARRIDPAQPVIVNISMGTLAGPKNGRAFLEWQIAREAQLWESATGQPVRIVWAFGNNNRTRQVAEMRYDAAANRTSTDRSITLRQQPGDRTPGYVLITPPAGMVSTAIEMAIEAPDGAALSFAPLAPGHMRSLMRGTDVVARLYHIPDRGLGGSDLTPAHYVLAIAPTDPKVVGEPLADSGAWTISARYTGKDAAVIRLQIERDDSLPGYGAEGRQAYFDAADAYGWDDDFADISGLGPDCKVTREASHNAFVTAADPSGVPGSARQVFSVGAAEWQAAPTAPRPARYTATGSSSTVPGPVCGAIAEDGRALTGLVASGTFSGSCAILNGTSAAAARVSRALATNAAVVAANAAAGGGTQMDDLSGLPMAPVAPALAARLGGGVLQQQAGARSRR